MEIIKAYRREIPAARFIGTKYGDEDRVNGMFGAKWGEWFENSRFGVIEQHIGDNKKFYEDSDAYIGLMRFKEGEPFQYWIGMFTPADTGVPEGFDYVDFPAGAIGVCWLYGPEDELYCKEYLCGIKLGEEGLDIITDDKGAYWFYERYADGRYAAPDDKGNIILDIVHYVK